MGQPDSELEKLQERLRLSDERLRTAEAAGGIGVFEVDLGSREWTLSPQVAALLGRALSSHAPTFSDLSEAMFFDDLPKVLNALDAARRSGTFEVEFRVRHGDGTIHWLTGRGQRLADVGDGTKLSGAFYDITERKTLEARLLAVNETLEARIAELADETRTLGVLHRTGTALAAELDLERLVQAVTDAGVELSGAGFGAFFYNNVSEKGEDYTLYTLSGASRAAFEKFPMPRNTAVFEPTFRGTAIVRSHDMLADPRYGKSDPYFGMPKGHLPVRSYLAVPVASRSGGVLGGLFFGHSQPGMFTDRAERLVVGLATQAAVAIDNVRLYQAVQRELAARNEAEQELRRTNETLEQRVAERASELAASHATLAATERRFRLLVENVTEYAIFMLDPTGHVVNWNAGAERIKGYRSEEIVGQHFSRFYTEADLREEVPSKAIEAARRTGKFATEGWRVRKDGSQFWASVLLNAIHDPNGELVGFAKITRDLTERRAAEEQLRQAQKMESVGQLTGGVAHDFNNLLTVIMGNLDALQRHLRDPEHDIARLQRSAENAMRGAKRAESVTQRLLAFSRQQPLMPTPTNVGRLFSGMSDLLRRTIGEQIAVETVLAAGLWMIEVDPNQLEVAILNLAVNARDAMHTGGKLTLETANVVLDEAYAAGQAEVVPGQYVMLAVSDNGAGMSPEVQAKAFDPFFTTKEVGHGTGLGLSQVYGFVKQSRGHVKIYSELGEGTSVKIYLPRFHGEHNSLATEAVSTAMVRAGHDEKILVVEDDEDVRASTTEMLRDLGYAIVEAADAAAALQLLDGNPEIKLLFTDIGLPGGMNGRQLADAARSRKASLKVLFTSGYTRNAIVHDGRLDRGVELISKPFTQSALAARLRDILDASAGKGRILVVEDEIMLQMLATDFLEERGLKADVAGSATDALNKLALIPGGVEAAVIDIGLPDRRGDVLFREIRAMHPSLPIVLVTGYGQAGIEPTLAKEPHVAFLSKPYTALTLCEALRSVGIRF